MQMLSEFGGLQVGPTVTFAETTIEVDGASYPVITILEAAQRWQAHAEEKGWSVRDLAGRKIIWP